MHIGIVTTWFERGASYVSRQYMNLLARKNEVFIYARGGEQYAVNDKEWDKDNVTWGKIVEGNSGAVDLEEFRLWVLKHKLDCVFFNEQNCWEPVIAMKEMKIKTGCYIDYYKRSTVKYFGIYDFLICNTQRHYSVFKNFPQTYFVPWGTDNDLFKPKTTGLVENNKITFFSSVGYNPERKGVDKTLEAFYEVAQNSECRLIIHTQVDIVKKYPELKGIVHELVENGKLEIIEKSVHAPGLYYRGDVYIYPSQLDGIGLTMAEALSSGLPLIITDEPPMNEFFVDGICQKVMVEKYIAREDAYYWPLSSVSKESLKKAMLYYINHKECVPEMKKAARKYAEEYLKWDSNAEKVNEIFQTTKIMTVTRELVDKARICDCENRSFPYRYLAVQKKIQSMERKFRKIDNRFVYIYGNGTHTKMLFLLTTIASYRVAGIVDKNYGGISENGIEIRNPESLRGKEDCVLIPSSYLLQEELIHKAVAEYGFCGEVFRIYDENDTHVFWL